MVIYFSMHLASYTFMHITIVDDVKENLDLYKELLQETYELTLIQDPLKLLDFLASNHTDLIVLDLHMPQMDGFTLYARFKETHPEIPAIFLSGDASEDSLVKGLNLGAEDFIVKPVSLKELSARINNKLMKNRGRQGENSKVTYGEFTLHCDLQMAELSGQRIQLTPIEFKFINLLAKNPNKLYTRDYIQKLLWPEVHVQNQNIDTHLSNLRKKLFPFSKFIKTIKSRGYILRI